MLDPKIPAGPLAEKWDRHRFESKLVNPANRRKYTVIIVHVWQFRFGTYYETGGEIPFRDLARTEFEVFSQPLWVALYVVATLLVGLHLRHGISSSFQSIGLDHPVYTKRLTRWGIFFAVLIAGGLAVIPVWVYLTQ